MPNPASSTGDEQTLEEILLYSGNLEGLSRGNCELSLGRLSALASAAIFELNPRENSLVQA
ncbi:hypothetical protein GCM10009120_07240 [Sphingobacterium siyangense subsp. cladoniae]